MMTRIVPIAIAALMLAACNKEAPSETASDVSQARQEAAENTAEAQQDASRAVARADDKLMDAQQDYASTDAKAARKLTKAEAEAMVKTANANYDVTVTEIEGRYKVSKQKCDALSGVDKDACLSTAKATYEADKAAAVAARDSALVDAEHHE